MMKIKCGWCDRFMGYKDGPDFEVTTGICAECAEAEKAAFKAKQDREMVRKYNAGVVDMIENLMMFDPIPRRSGDAR